MQEMTTPVQRRPRALPEQLTYSVQEAGYMLGVGRNQVYDAVARGELPALRLGKRWLILKSAFDKLLAGAEAQG